MPRSVDVAVLSDVHLGTRHCMARRLLAYLNHIDARILILNGDILDLIKRKPSWHETHWQVIHTIFGMLKKGTTVYYITGNHDVTLRHFSGLQLDNFHLVNRLEMDLPNSGRTLFLHGDIFDVHMGHKHYLKNIGGWSYDQLMTLSTWYNNARKKLGLRPFSLATAIKNNIGSANRYIEKFTHIAAEYAQANNYDHIICGHIHRYALCEEINGVKYSNSGDWVEHATALEYYDNCWHLFKTEEQLERNSTNRHHSEALGESSHVVAAMKLLQSKI